MPYTEGWSKGPKGVWTPYVLDFLGKCCFPMSYSVITRCLCLGDKNRPYSSSSILKGRVQTKSRCWFLLKALRTLALVSARVLELVRPSWTGASHPLQRAVPGALLCHVIYKMLNTEHYEHSKKKHLMGP